MAPTKLLLSKEIENDTTLPSWVRVNPIFQKIKYVRKIFPEYGLANYCEPASMGSDDVVAAAQDLVFALKNVFSDRISGLERFLERAKVGEARRKFAEDLLFLFNELLLLPNNSFLAKSEKGLITLILPVNICSRIKEGQILFKAGMGLFKLYGRIVENLKKHAFLSLPALEELESYRAFSAVNLPNKDLSIVFSSTGKEGFWDLLTMSMRGITSCQTWDNANNFTRILGSAVDPLTGIIYITNGKEDKYGTNMIRRCIVRFAISSAGEKTIVLEKMYPSFDKQSLAAFKTSILKYFDGKIIYIGNAKEDREDQRIAAQYLSPLTPELKLIPQHLRPYIDSKIAYSKTYDNRDHFALQTDNVKSLFVESMSNDFIKILKSPKSLRDVDASATTIKFLEKLRSKEKDKKIVFEGKKILATDFARTVANALAEVAFTKFYNRHMRFPEPNALIELFASYLLRFKIEETNAYRLSAKIVQSIENSIYYS